MANSCTGCGGELPLNAKFCPQCGASQGVRAKPIAKSGIVAVVLVAAGIWGGVWYVQSQLAGTKPTRPFAATSAISDPQMHALQQKTKSAPDDIEGWRNLAQALIDKLSSAAAPNNEDIFDLIDALREILRLDPKDLQALQAMAELSFRQKVFDKAVEYYARYVALVPDDLDARSRYGSVLALMGKTAEAEAELNLVLKSKPDDFSANAYHSLLLAQKGEIANARASARKAVAAAPSAEAKKEFGVFLERLENTAEGTKILPTAEPAGGQKASSLDQFFKGNAVAGPKFVRSEVAENGFIKVYFNQFPMSAMPPFAREKFFASIKEFVQRELKTLPVTILFVDATSGEELDRLEVLKP